MIGLIRIVKEMASWFKIGLVLLTVFSVVSLGISFAAEVNYTPELKYGDLRDYYPFGMYITATELEEAPPNFIVLTNDTYVQEAIESGNETWVQQDDPKSEFMNKGKPEIILWKDGNYYFISQAFSDGIPPSWIHPPYLKQTAQLLLIPWTIFLIVGIIQRIRSSLKLTNEHCT